MSSQAGSGLAGDLTVDTGYHSGSHQRADAVAHDGSLRSDLLLQREYSGDVALGTPTAAGAAAPSAVQPWSSCGGAAGCCCDDDDHLQCNGCAAEGAEANAMPAAAELQQRATANGPAASELSIQNALPNGATRQSADALCAPQSATGLPQPLASGAADSAGATVPAAAAVQRALPSAAPEPLVELVELLQYDTSEFEEAGLGPRCGGAGDAAGGADAATSATSAVRALDGAVLDSALEPEDGRAGGAGSGMGGTGLTRSPTRSTTRVKYE